MDEHLISDDELDALLAERDPLNTTPLNARRVESALTRLAHDISATSRLASTPRRRLRVRRRLVAVAAAGVAVAAVALVGVSLLGGGSTTSLLPTLQLPVAQAAQLDRIAQATAAGPSAGHGKWLYLKLTTTKHQGLQIENSPVIFYVVTETVQQWSASADGPNRVRVTFSDFAFTSPRSRKVYESHRALFAQALAPLPLTTGHTAVVDATIRGTAISPTEIGNGSDERVPLSSLPTDPNALVKLLGRNDLKGFHPGTKQLTPAQRRQQQQFITENHALGEWIGLSQILIASTSAPQRAEAYRALTLVRFVHVLLGERRDSRGRPGIEVSFHEPGAGSPLEALIIDPHTGDLLQDNSGSGSVAVWLARAVVDSDTELPGGGNQPAPPTTSPQSQLEIFRAIGGRVG
jgi:hypothetical protein